MAVTHGVELTSQTSMYQIFTSWVLALTPSTLKLTLPTHTPTLPEKRGLIAKDRLPFSDCD